MAFKNNLELHGLDVPNAYWRVGSIQVSTLDISHLSIRLDGYASQQARDNGKSALVSLNAEIPVEGTLVTLLDRVQREVYKSLKQNTVQFSNAEEV